MDQISPLHSLERQDPFASHDPFEPGMGPEEPPPPRRGRTLKRLALTVLAATALAGGIAAGYHGGRTNWPLPGWLPAPAVAILNGPAPTAGGPVAYYRHPDGQLAYSASPKKTEDGRDYLPVPASADVSFDEKPNDAPAGQTAADQGGGKKILYYRNPMGLPDTSPVPKKDSMGMDYIPVYEGEAEDGSTVTVTPGKLQRTGVRTEAVERRVVIRPVRAPGTVKLDERRVTVITLRSEGFIDKVENVTTGERVRKGDPLLRLYSPDIAAASAQYLSVLNEGNGGAGRPLVLEGARRRLENLNVPPEVIAEIERTRKVPLSVTWSAPRDGVILERNAIEGMRAMPGDVLFRLADISTVWILADVPEHDLGAVKPDQAVTLRVRSLPGQTFSGRVDLIYPQVNPETRTARVRIEIPNRDGALLPDMYADVEFATGSGKPVVAVPDSALIDTGTRQVVIVDKGEGRFEPREVKVGARGNGFVEIREGIAAGDQVVTSANFLIDAESNLKAALQGMTAPAEEKPQ
ncbi:efflux RND transporter periplasmic adaptor subunit [Microvirga arabica]|uniref:efflux RND transporter periplasmic adaptor subunit n=1 Tax=Microvirga arabica TaxID=1128671 RepID=UPI00193A339C|nr:efflux RND transporter periplasmic adaptor subunit [Microvirga arabica]MBM1170130.1 efflux RND transporter periplasmic adaptor subunit [Microvirga arabica]